MARRSRAPLLLLATLLLLAALPGCGVLPQTGPPESDFFERGDHGRP